MNESFDQRIWNMCKKDKRFEADQLEISIFQNILIHNLCYEHGTLLNSFGINITKSINALWNIQEKAHYTFIIKNNNSVEGMQGDIHTIVVHITSTDENPMHDNCPEHQPKDNLSYKSFCFIKIFQWRKNVKL